MLKKATYVGAALLIYSCGASVSHAEGVTAGGVNREVLQTLPSLKTDSFGLPSSFSEKRKKQNVSEKKKRLIEDPLVDLPEDSHLGSPVNKIVVSSPVLEGEIRKIVQEKIIERTRISRDDLSSLRQKIWELGLKNNKLLHSKFKIIANSKERGKSWLAVQITEMMVGKVIVEDDGSLRQGVLDDIKREVTAQFFMEKALDLEELDESIKSRLVLGDVDIRTTVLPVDETHIDLKVSVNSAPEKAWSGLARYDNAGGWSFGRDRFIAGLSGQPFVAGDELSLIAMKTVDIGNGDYGNGMYFGRAEYTAPVGEWGIKMKVWASGLHYHEVSSVLNGSRTNGEALEFGQGVLYPVYLDKTTRLNLQPEYFTRYTVDRALETERTGEKVEYAGQIKVSLQKGLSRDQNVQINADWMIGRMDLSEDKLAYQQDQTTAKTDGIFTKVVGEGLWSGKIDEEKEFDYKLGAKGQWTPTNLDSTEQFSLGGMNGLRAYGSGEASGDIGLMANAEFGYMVSEGVRPFVFYDAGQIWKSAHSWSGEGDNLSYFLHDLGIGLGVVIGPLDMNIGFARQVGPNPGVTSSGQDIDNTKQRYRLWSSVSYRF